MEANASWFTGAVPVLASEKIRLAEAPTVLFPNARLEGVTWRCDWAPVPVRFATSGKLVSDVAMLTAPVRVPGREGVKVICRVQLAVGASWDPAAGQLPATV
jgi:hypothetical protein